MKGGNGVKRVKLVLVGLLLGGFVGNSESFGAAAAGLTRTNSGGGVTVKVTYPHSQGADETRFEVVLDTHSVNLDAYDLKTLSIVRDDAGKSYQAAGAENKGSGHHREATLTFPKIPPEVKVLELVIRDVAGVKERVFRWDLK